MSAWTWSRPLPHVGTRDWTNCPSPNKTNQSPDQSWSQGGWITTMKRAGELPPPFYRPRPLTWVLTQGGGARLPASPHWEKDTWEQLKTAKQSQTFSKINLDAKQTWEEKKRYLVLGISERNPERLHGSDHGLHGGEDVLVDQFGVAPLVVICVSSSVDNPHLFDEGTLSTLSSTCWIPRGLNPLMSFHTHPSVSVQLDTKSEVGVWYNIVGFFCIQMCNRACFGQTETLKKAGPLHLRQYIINALPHMFAVSV